MQAVVSAVAGKAFLMEGDRCFSISADAPGDVISLRTEEFLRCLDGASDLLFLEASDLEEVRTRLRQAVDEEEALTLTLICLDPQHSDTIRRQAAAELNDLLLEAGEALVNVLHARPLPAEADLNGALKAARQSSAWRVQQLLHSLRDSQLAIRRVCHAWIQVPDRLFASRSDRQRVRKALIQAGLFRGLAGAEQGKATFDVVFSNAMKDPTLSKLQRLREILRQWVRPLEPSSSARPTLLQLADAAASSPASAVVAEDPPAYSTGFPQEADAAAGGEAEDCQAPPCDSARHPDEADKRRK